MNLMKKTGTNIKYVNPKGLIKGNKNFISTLNIPSDLDERMNWIEWPPIRR